MARKNRFGDLQRALNLLRPTGAGSTTGDSPDAPAGTRLRFFQDWRKGPRAVTYTRTPDSRPDKLVERRIELFNAGSTNNVAKALVSQRANSAIGTVGLSPASLGFVTTAASYPGKFIPAKITVYTGGARATTNEFSKLTGIPYKPRANNKSYTYPFGRVGTTNYADTARALIADAKAVAIVVGASCRPEDLIIN